MGFDDPAYLPPLVFQKTKRGVPMISFKYLVAAMDFILMIVFIKLGISLAKQGKGDKASGQLSVAFALIYFSSVVAIMV